ncbi:MAG: AAA family ATPase [Gammaproteobacteria bacterium]
MGTELAHETTGDAPLSAMNAATAYPLIAALQNAALYDHPIRAFSLVETHISWVLLTGCYAYKIKKPVAFQFADFSTLERRRFYCEEELRLNRRFAPELYIEVVPITGSIQRPSVAGKGEPIEYAVKMREFPQHALLSHVAAQGKLTAGHVDALAAALAASHAQLPPAAPAAPFGQPDQVHHWSQQNFAHMEAWLKQSTDLRTLAALRVWVEEEFARRRHQFQSRKDQGFIRECHGDLHLGNLVLLDGRIVAFDCIEFNDQLRWIDVMSELAFTVMDLRDRGYPSLACRFLNRYLERSGDYAGLGVLRYYLVYRALVRAKVALLRLVEQAGLVPQAASNWHEYQSYLKLALSFSQERRRGLVITHGVSGSGKSTVAAALVESLGAILIRSDVERKRLYGLRANARTHAGLGRSIYSPQATRVTYERLSVLAASALDFDLPVIIDATFLRRSERDRLRQLAIGLRVPFVILDCKAPEMLLRERVAHRAQAGETVSEAGTEVLTVQLQTQQPLEEDELRQSISLDASRMPAADDLAHAVDERLRV